MISSTDVMTAELTRNLAFDCDYINLCSTGSPPYFQHSITPHTDAQLQVHSTTGFNQANHPGLALINDAE